MDHQKGLLAKRKLKVIKLKVNFVSEYKWGHSRKN